VGHDLAIVIVTYNSGSDLQRCLETVFAAARGIDFHVVVSDSGSTDHTLSVARRFPVTCIAGGDQGFARACNRSLGLHAVRNSRYVLLLNPDTEILTGSLAELVAECDRWSDRRLFTVRQVDAENRLVHTLRRFPSVGTLFADAFPVAGLRWRGERITDPGVYERVSECDWAMGSFLILPRAALHDVSGFDERFFVYSEEVDLCRRARAHGWTVTYLPSVTISHVGQSRVRDRRRAHHHARAKLIYAEKWNTRPERLLIRAALVIRYARVALRARSPDARRSARTGLLALLRYRSPAERHGSAGRETAPRHRRPPLPDTDRERLLRRRVWRDGEPEPEPVSEVARYIEHGAGRLALSLQLAERLLEGRHDPRILELGSEPWMFTQLLAERGYAVTAAGLRPGDDSDRAEVTIEWDRWSITLEQYLFDVERDAWPLADGSFDVVLAMEVIEHLNLSPAHMLHEANRVLVPGGHLLLTTPNALAARKLAALIRGRTVHHRYSGYGPHGRHNREFTPEEVRLVLEEANFSVEVWKENVAGYEAEEPLGRVLRGVAALPGRGTARRRDYLFAIAGKVGPPRLAFPAALYMSMDRDRMRREGVSFPDEHAVMS
jgi:N-acetylglucosaminyl-diphospho-decaprenol L-rhamnosyltransferase